MRMMEGCRAVLIATMLFIASVVATGCGSFRDEKGGDNTIGTDSYSISGSVISGDVGFSDVLLTLSGKATRTATSDAEGNYSFTDLVNGSYTVTPSKSGYSFNPESIVLEVGGANAAGRNFTAAPRTCPLSGEVTIDGAAFPGVLLTLSGRGTGTAETASDGSYTFPGLVSGSYTVTPSKAGFSFSPDYLSVEISDSARTGQSFAAVPLTYSISGNIAEGSAGLPGVTVALTGAASAPTTTTDSSGNYRFTDIADGLYTITPFKTGYVFMPGSMSAEISGNSITGRNFTGTPVTTATRTIPDTGQTSCYGPEGGVIACAGTGQDGAYTINPPSYTDNGDGTITDNVTGLVWQKQDDGIRRTWDDANAYCSGNVPGLPGEGWRLGTSAEMNTIVDYGRYLPAINTKYFPNTNIQSDGGIYWSSTAVAGNPALAWYQIFLYGFVVSGDKNIPYYVRCVR